MKALQLLFALKARLVCRADHQGFSDGGGWRLGERGYQPKEAMELQGAASKGGEQGPSDSPGPRCNQEAPSNAGHSIAVLRVVMRGVTQERRTMQSQGAFPAASHLHRTLPSQDGGPVFHGVGWLFTHSFIIHTY